MGWKLRNSAQENLVNSPGNDNNNDPVLPIMSTQCLPSHPRHPKPPHLHQYDPLGNLSLELVDESVIAQSKLMFHVSRATPAEINEAIKIDRFKEKLPKRAPSGGSTLSKKKRKRRQKTSLKRREKKKRHPLIAFCAF